MKKENGIETGLDTLSINGMLSSHSRHFLKNYRDVFCPKILSLIRHTLAGLSEPMQRVVTDNLLLYLTYGRMIMTPSVNVNRLLGYLLLVLMNDEGITPHQL